MLPASATPKMDDKMKRASKYVRPRHPELMVMTDRDKDILTRAWEDRMLELSVHISYISGD